MEERRKYIRQRVLLGARICFTGGASPVGCVVRDISAGGARLIVSTVQGIPSEFKLVFEDQTRRDCFIRWTATDMMGVSFLSPQAASLAA